MINKPCRRPPCRRIGRTFLTMPARLADCIRDGICQRIRKLRNISVLAASMVFQRLIQTNHVHLPARKRAKPCISLRIIVFHQVLVNFTLIIQCSRKVQEGILMDWLAEFDVIQKFSNINITRSIPDAFAALDFPAARTVLPFHKISRHMFRIKMPKSKVQHAMCYYICPFPRFQIHVLV